MSKLYLVGGAVRDELIGVEPHDQDFVVVGSTIEEMLQKGYKQVGKEFPVFLDIMGNEVALARKERKIGDKHGDFEFQFDKNVTLEEDVLRRDFTVNALAKDIKTGEIIDYVNGQQDIKLNRLRAVRPDTFIEDPLRVFRAARFSAQLNYEVEPLTKRLCWKMAQEGMLKHLSAERVWKELEKALQPDNCSEKFMEFLLEINALEDWFPEFIDLANAKEQKKFHWSENSFKHTMIALSRVQDCSAKVKFAVLCHDLGKGNTPKDILPKHIGHDLRGLALIDSLCDRLKAPNEYRDFAKTFCLHHMRCHKMAQMKLAKQYDLVKCLSDNFKDKELLEDFLTCAYADTFGEEVPSEFNDDSKFFELCDRMRKIFDIMHGVNLQTFDERTQQMLMRHSGEDFGKVYNETKIRYLKSKMGE
ncbi:MAG: multifunctional CCA tRNA nucleotidyl transferase/2'3'-cyclic phosphodiesterase/2'nucleotidase/phosphatase [Bacilli bacterium]|nr:multifunctional CCA tRNA nucleotidyl transferase/2'3'-cyclic phosphodiesterase/2'nucleotidase/phosphatase [Bacilli bacterium]